MAPCGQNSGFSVSLRYSKRKPKLKALYGPIVLSSSTMAFYSFPNQGNSDSYRGVLGHSSEIYPCFFSFLLWFRFFTFPSIDHFFEILFPHLPPGPLPFCSGQFVQLILRVLLCLHYLFLFVSLTSAWLRLEAFFFFFSSIFWFFKLLFFVLRLS